MPPEISKLKTLYLQLDRQQAAGEDVVADLKKEINNLELSYLKEQVLPQVAQFMASKVRGLRCGIDSSFQFDGEQSINYSFCTSGTMLFIKDSLDVNSASSISEKTSPQPKDVTPSLLQPKTGTAPTQRSIRLVEYSEKAVALYGDTKDFYEELKDLDGYFNAHLHGGVGWVFPKKRIPDLRELLGSYLQDESHIEDQKHKEDIFTGNGIDDGSALSEDQWIKMLLSMRGTQVKGLTSPHKAIFILAIIESIQRGCIREKRIFATTALSDTFMRIWNKYVPAEWPFRGNAFQPYIHMSSEPFYFLVNAEGVNNFDINQNWSRPLVVKYIEYAYLDTQLFELLHKRSFIDRLSKELIDKFIIGQSKLLAKPKPIIETTTNVNAFAGYKRYLSTLTSNIGKPYSASSINVYATALRSKYMQAKVSKFAGIPDLEMVSELSVIDKILHEVKYEAEHGMINKTSYLALKMFRDYHSLNASTPQESTPVLSAPVAQQPKEEPTPHGDPIGIHSIDAEHIHVKNGKLKDMFATFLNEIGPELVYDMKINYMGANLIDTKENPFFVDNCVKLNGGYWVNVSPRSQTIANQIKKICEFLDMDVSITMEHENIKDDYKIASKPRATFSLNGGRPLNKRRTVLETIRLYVKTHPSATYEQLESAFPKELQGGYGVITPISTIQRRIQNGYDDERRYFLDRDKILRSSDGIEYAVCHQWGHQFAHFQTYVSKTFNWIIEEI